MNDDTTVEVLLTMQDQATPQLHGFNRAIIQNRSAIRELSMGTMYLGSAMLGMAVAMQSSKSAAIRNTGEMFAMVGGIMVAVGSAARFVSAIGRMVSALQRLNIAQMVTQALSGPVGWATLAGGLAIAGGAAYGISRMTGGGQRQAASITVHQHIAGSVVTERQLTESIHQGLILKGQRNAGTGIQ